MSHGPVDVTPLIEHPLTQQERFLLLAQACRIFTQGLGMEGGYYPSLGAPATQKAIELMKKAGIDPVWYREGRETR